MVCPYSMDKNHIFPISYYYPILNDKIVPTTTEIKLTLINMTLPLIKSKKKKGEQGDLFHTVFDLQSEEYHF